MTFEGLGIWLASPGGRPLFIFSQTFPGKNSDPAPPGLAPFLFIVCISPRPNFGKQMIFLLIQLFVLMISDFEREMLSNLAQIEFVKKSTLNRKDTGESHKMRVFRIEPESHRKVVHLFIILIVSPFHDLESLLFSSY